MLTVKDQTTDIVVGLKLGADDYVTKPFEAAELMARIEVLLRRVPAHTGHAVHQFGSIIVDVPRGEVTQDGKQIYFTRREFQLLCYLMERAGSTVPRIELLRSVWGYDSEAFTRTVDSHIASIRQKLGEDPKRPEFIHTTTGVGYKFVGATVRRQNL
jgi:two-component system, OmpR family, alkaline phosphatase synthesis response regulator PhoP